MFRFLFVLQALVLLVNPKVLLHLQNNAGNVLQKLLIILSGIALMTTRPMHRGVVALIAAIVALTFVCALGTDFPAFEWRLYIGGVVSAVAPFILLTAQPDAEDRRLGLVVFALLPLLMTVLGGLYQLAGIAPLFDSDPQAGTRLGATQGPAYLAAMCFTGTYAALELAERRHLGYTALLAVNTVILVLAGGRMALAMGFLVCGIAYLRSFRRMPLLKIFIPIWFIGLGGILLVYFGEDTLRHLSSTSLSNRDLIWAALNRHLHAHPWFGVGLGNQQLLVPASLTGKTGTFAGHNEYLRITVELGYPGAVLFFALTLGIFLLVWNSAWVRRDPMFLVCAVAFYIYGITDNTFSVPQAYFILAAASFACQRPAVAARHAADEPPSQSAAAPLAGRSGAAPLRGPS